MRNCQRALLVVAALFSSLMLAKTVQWRRVVAGLEADISNFPEVALLQYLNGVGTICTGVIIQPRWLISAAHCFHPKKAGLNPDNAQVRVGSPYASSGGDIYRLELAVTHQLYDPDYSFNDIGIAKTTEPFQFSGSVQVAVVADASTEIPTPGTICTVVGYGQTRNPDWDKPEAVRLRMRDIPILESEVCEEHYSFDPATQLCAGSPTEFMGSNYGDSGGPLFCNGIVAALVEGGPNWWDSGGPNIYTEITAFRQDIQDVIDTM